MVLLSFPSRAEPFDPEYISFAYGSFTFSEARQHRGQRS
jgi:hypothetical protein